MRKPQTKQKKLRKEKFSHDEYWNVHYTEVLEDKSERDYKTIIKANSAALAKLILQKKVKNDFPKHRVKSIQLFMLTSTSLINDLRLTIQDWECIRNAAFPNPADFLFKYHNPRPEGYSNRFNTMKGVNNKNQFRAGFSPNTYVPPESEKPYWIFDGKWKKWDPKERELLKKKLQLALSMHKNSRQDAAKFLGMTRKRFYYLINKKFVEVDWEKDFPPTRGNVEVLRMYENKRIANMRAAHEKRKLEYTKKMHPKVMKLINQGYTKTKTAEILQTSKKIVNRCIEYETN